MRKALPLGAGEVMAAKKVGVAGTGPLSSVCCRTRVLADTLNSTQSCLKVHNILAEVWSLRLVSGGQMCICVCDAPTVGTKELVSFQEADEWACIVKSSGKLVQRSRNIFGDKVFPLCWTKSMLL